MMTRRYLIIKPQKGRRRDTKEKCGLSGKNKQKKLLLQLQKTK
jgi:hypothetical protein